MELVSSLIFSFIFMNLMFTWTVKEDNYGLIDIGWGLFFIVISCSSLLVSPYFASHSIIYLSIIFLWGARLSFYLFKRNHGKEEDERYTEFRMHWRGSQHLNGYFRIYFVQLILAHLVALPIHGLTHIENFRFDFFFYLGISIWLLGFGIESLADLQKAQFKKVSSQEICKKGLWRYSRHPNYFGEVLLWWGFWLSLSNKAPWWTVLGPISISYLIIFFSGIPMLEKKKIHNADYQEYKKETSAFIPWFVKKN